MSKNWDSWNYVVWVSGSDDYYANYEDAKRDYDEWLDKGYDEVQLWKLLQSTDTERK